MTPGLGRAALLGPAPALRGRGGYCPHGAHRTTATSHPGEKTRRPQGLRPREVLPSAPRSRCKGPAGRGPSRRRRQAAAGCGAAAGSCVLGLLPSHHELHGGPGAPLTRGSPLQPARALCPLAAPQQGRSSRGEEDWPRARSAGLEGSKGQVPSVLSPAPPLSSSWRRLSRPPAPPEAARALLRAQLPPLAPARRARQLQLPARAAAKISRRPGREGGGGARPLPELQLPAGRGARKRSVRLATEAVANGAVRGDIGLEGSCEYGGSLSSSGARRGEGQPCWSRSGGCGALARSGGVAEERGWRGSVLCRAEEQLGLGLPSPSGCLRPVRLPSFLPPSSWGKAGCLTACLLFFGVFFFTLAL